MQPGILGSTIIADQLLLLLDVHGLVDTLLPEYKRIKPAQTESHGQAVLVVEDSPFFRKQIVSCLTEAGVETISAEDGEAGLLALEQNASKVGLIITDIEMPKMDGLEMTRRIRLDARMQDMPILACTTLSGDVAERRGREAGLTEYLIKLDRELILERTNHHLKSQRAGVAVRTGA
jgi:two-component system chemotaxis sensor kinase CheA